ncbi:natural killer cells antigen CD94-like [Choloepus didactylus]|uniref:natural killer cells antigen CD94-like n=1 Tax=Choloepus didactylus TaxID=27675 RepID=UPI00189D3ECF|nr:natural killer cells antigen CD94-like [Choloepus didactylus]
MAAFQSTPWSCISGTLGIICFLLMATLGILLKMSYTKQKIQPPLSPGSTEELQEGSDCCSCREKWIGYKCNCYFFSNEQKPWAESRDFCASQNSSLLQLESRDELGFAKSLQYFHWIGLSYSHASSAWLWEDGSTLSFDLFSFPLSQNPERCILYSLSEGLLEESCVRKHPYICKQRLM